MGNIQKTSRIHSKIYSKQGLTPLLRSLVRGTRSLLRVKEPNIDKDKNLIKYHFTAYR